MKFIFSLLVLLSSCSPLVVDRDKLIEDLMVTSGHIEQVEVQINALKKELLRLYPNLTENMFENEFKELFEEYEKNSIKSYSHAYNELTEDELVKLRDFYQTDKGKWIIKVSLQVSDNIQKYFDYTTAVFNDGFIKKYNKLGIDSQ